jgi:hypothetical protein
MSLTNGKTLYRNIEYDKKQHSVNRLIIFLNELKLRYTADNYDDAHNICHGFTHRVVGISAYIEETPYEQRLKASESNSRT